MSAYEIVWAEIRRVVPGTPHWDWPPILHDHGGTLSDCCIHKVLEELNRLAEEVQALTYELLSIRDIAVCNWDIPVVEASDQATAHVQQTVKDGYTTTYRRQLDTIKTLNEELLRIRTTNHGAAHELDNMAIELGLGHSPKPGAVAEAVRALVGENNALKAKASAFDTFIAAILALEPHSQSPSSTVEALLDKVKEARDLRARIARLEDAEAARKDASQ